MTRIKSSDWGISIPQNGKSVVEFSTPWCGPCKIQKRILQDVENEHVVFVGEVDVEEEFELADMMGVTSVPTLIVMSNGKEVTRLNGLQQKSTLDALLS